MNPISLVIIFKGIGMLTVIIGGIGIARYGFHLYKDGAGMGKDQAAFELGKIKVKASSAGSIIMSTAFLWAFAGVLLSPNLEKKGEEIKIYSMESHVGEIEAAELTVYTKSSSPLNLDGESLRKMFKAAMESMSKKTGTPAVKINGQAAHTAAYQIKPDISSDGKKLFSTRAVTNENTEATIDYEAEIYNKKVTFTPTRSLPETIKESK